MLNRKDLEMQRIELNPVHIRYYLFIFGLSCYCDAQQLFNVQPISKCSLN